MFKAARFISLCRLVSQTEKHLENSYGNYKTDLGLFSNQRPDLLVERIILLLGAQTGGRYFFSDIYFANTYKQMTIIKLYKIANFFI